MAAMPRLTAEDLERMGSDGERLELFDGIPREKSGEGGRHGEIAAEVMLALWTQVRPQDLGRLYPSTQFTFRRNPDTILIPDVAFVRVDRLPPKSERWGIPRFAPDLAVEVISPTDTYDAVMERMDLYLTAGIPLVWLVLGRSQTVDVRRHGRPPFTLAEADTLDGGDIVPGFRLPVAEIFR